MNSNQPPVRCCSGLWCTGVGGALRSTREDFDRLALLCRPCGEYGSSGVVRLMPAIAPLPRGLVGRLLMIREGWIQL